MFLEHRKADATVNRSFTQFRNIATHEGLEPNLAEVSAVVMNHCGDGGGARITGQSPRS
jgi:hypothetical protein